MLAGLQCILRRDMVLAVRRPTDVLNTLFFFIIAVSLFPLGVGPQKDTLSLIAPGVIWVAALLAAMLSLGRMFSRDFEDGTLEQMALAPQSLSLLVLGKVAAHWLGSGLPLVLIAPLLGLQLGLDTNSLYILMISLLVGTPVLSLIGAVGAALTLGLRGGGVLISLLVLPLYVPVLIFGAGAVEAARSGLGAQGHLSLLAAFLVFAAVFAPWTTAAAVRISIE